MVQALHERYFPRMLHGAGRRLLGEVAAGRIRDLPVVPLLRQMVGPLAFHPLLCPVAEHLDDTNLPATEETVESSPGRSRGLSGTSDARRPTDVAAAAGGRSCQLGRPRRIMAR
ncbi:hypothetical protein SGLAM104S_09418 [Streptomyces glaucescens]